MIVRIRIPGTSYLGLSARHNRSIFVKNSFGPRISIASSSHLSGGPPLVSTHFTGRSGNQLIARTKSLNST